MEEGFLVLLDLVHDEMRQLIEGVADRGIERDNPLVMGELLDEFLAAQNINLGIVQAENQHACGRVKLKVDCRMRIDQLGIHARLIQQFVTAPVA